MVRWFTTLCTPSVPRATVVARERPALLVTVPFSVFSADPVQNMQFAFISNCRDETTTYHGAQRPFA